MKEGQTHTLTNNRSPFPLFTDQVWHNLHFLWECTFSFFLFFFIKLADGQQLTADSTITDNTCQTRDPAFAVNEVSEPSQRKMYYYRSLLLFLTMHLNSSCSCGLSVGLQIILFQHSGLSASKGHSLHPAVWGKHLHLRSKRVHPVCLFQRSGAAVREQQLCLEHLEGENIM